MCTIIYRKSQTDIWENDDDLVKCACDTYHRFECMALERVFIYVCCVSFLCFVFLFFFPCLQNVHEVEMILYDLRGARQNNRGYILGICSQGGNPYDNGWHQGKRDLGDILVVLRLV